MRKKQTHTKGNTMSNVEIIKNVNGKNWRLEKINSGILLSYQDSRYGVGWIMYNTYSNKNVCLKIIQKK